MRYLRILILLGAYFRTNLQSDYGTASAALEASEVSMADMKAQLMNKSACIEQLTAEVKSASKTTMDLQRNIVYVWYRTCAMRTATRVA